MHIFWYFFGWFFDRTKDDQGFWAGGGRAEGLRVERERIANLSSADFLFWNWKKLGILLTLILEK